MLDLKSLNRQQLQAAKHQSGPMLVVAGAGTGKTQVITYRIAYVLERLKAKPAEILAVTFTEKAATEMANRVSTILNKFIIDVKITTFNAFGNELLERFSFDLGLSKELKLMNEAQQVVFLRDHIDQLGLKYYAPITNPQGMLAELARYFGQLKNELITPAQYQEFSQKLTKAASSDSELLEAERHQELSQAYQAYQQLARQQGLIDYDDQVYLAVELLRRRANITSKLQSELKYLLVDEFQDTNKAQAVLIDLLVGGNQNIMVVGDDDQSIYKFRGAALANILEFKKRYPKAEQLALVKNYRSTQAILDSAYQLIQHNNPDRLEARYRISKHLIGQVRGVGPKLKQFVNIEQEAAWIAADIKRQLKRAAPEQIAILLRKNAQAKLLEKYLQSEEIDYLVVGQLENLYQTPDVKLVLSFLRAVVDPTDDESLYRLLTSSVVGSTPSQLRPIVSQAKRSRTSLEGLLTATKSEGDAKITSFIDQLHAWRDLSSKLSVGQLCYRFLKDSGYLKKLIGKAKQDVSLDQRIADLNQFFTTLLDYERVALDSSVVGYLENLPALLGTGERTTIEDLPEVFGHKVRLLTVHKAKGLEFDIVYLFDLTQGTFPARPRGGNLEIPLDLSSQNMSFENPHIQEERRLMYVAMTRAKKQLILSYSLDHGGTRPQKPSLFLGEALGEYPLLAAPTQTDASTSQIELFDEKQPKRARKSDLPLTFFDGTRLVLSEHQIEDYLRCPAEFKLRYLIGPPIQQTFALEYGTLIHNLIQLYNRRQLDKRPLTLANLMRYLEQNWPSEGFLSAGHERRSLAQAKQTLRRFYKREQAKVRHPTYIEHSFGCELPELEVVVKGRIDAVYQDKDQIEIRDYKTGAQAVSDQAKADQKAKSSLQLGVYNLAWQRQSGQAVESVTLDFVDSGYIGQATKTERQLQAVLAKIERAANGIRAGNFKPGSSHLFCSHQEYGF